MNRFRIKHWSCTPFSDWLRGIPKIKYGTSSEWQTWNKKCENEHPFRYWLAETVLNKLQDVVYFPSDVFYTFRSWFRNKFIDTPHLLKTDLVPGRWYDFDDRLLHGMFEGLVFFVEEEKGGVTSMLWETKLRVDDSFYGFTSDIPMPEKDRPDNWGELTGQAKGALEIIDLYVWWKFIRPARVDPLDGSGYVEYLDLRRESGKDVLDFSRDNNEDLNLLADGALAFSQAFEERYDQEDTEMMIRLINVRKHMWT